MGTFASGITGAFVPELVAPTFAAGWADKSVPGLIVPFIVALGGGFAPGLGGLVLGEASA